MINQLNTVTVFAPATCANVIVGFDVLGFAVDGLGDEITLKKSKEPGLEIESITGIEHIPFTVNKNTATVALNAMLEFLKMEQGFKIHIKKGIPLSSGLGGSAASSVAALIALNRFLIKPLPIEQLVEFALLGEHTACGSKHADNVIPCLYGGMTLIESTDPLRSINLPLLPLHAVFIHPHIQLETRDSRAVLHESISLSLFTKQNARMASFISALYEENYERLELSLVDELIEPMRAHLIPFYYDVKSVAYQYGALACSISGSGPTLFAFAKTEQIARKVADGMVWKFKTNGIQCDSVITSIAKTGARVVDEE
ncbi:homoserine kinase [Legionella quateirensis]|uniref:Homoserine kinase n=1 Tax=Legionella quateirensis TaxID=45072 RepID=A0A378KT49_9GAMM|nr:homoserine kinase [Legionella quateirensis]KTD51032.1 Homoserine kinase [Legionella quateirensis]STY17722.1 Homoserine kinase [Legionella quateirensis]